MNTIIRRAIIAWELWRSKRKLHRAIPALSELDRQLAEYRKSHKRGSARIIKAKQAAIHAAMGRL